jgi:hypothetical protein
MGIVDGNREKGQRFKLRDGNRDMGVEIKEYR